MQITIADAFTLAVLEGAKSMSKVVKIVDSDNFRHNFLYKDSTEVAVKMLLHEFRRLLNKGRDHYAALYD